MGRRSYTATVETSAPRAQLWMLLADVVSWPSWTPTMNSVRTTDGQVLAQGATFVVKQPGLPAATFEVTSFIEGRAFTWVASSSGVTTVAGHVLADVGDGRTRVELSLEMSGPAVGLLWLLMGRKVREFVDTEARCLVRASESGLPDPTREEKPT